MRPKRFKVGDRVLAIVNGWQSGTVTQLDYREDNWEAGQVSAYPFFLTPLVIRTDMRARTRRHEEYVREILLNNSELARTDCKYAGSSNVLVLVKTALFTMSASTL